ELFRPLALGDVATDLGGADNLPRSVAQGRHGQRDIDAAAVLGDAERLIVVDAFAPLQSGEDLTLFAVQLGGNQAEDRLADHLARLVTENARRAAVPRGDDALQTLADQWTVPRID